MMTSLHYQYQFEHYLSHTQFLSIAKQTIGEVVSKQWNTYPISLFVQIQTYYRPI
ncbi:MAG: hypothetical protein PUB31_03955 [Bacteroidales bacterium]|nr:hypothetical protein [Bacteroidales bacterium]